MCMLLLNSAYASFLFLDTSRMFSPIFGLDTEPFSRWTEILFYLPFFNATELKQFLLLKEVYYLFFFFSSIFFISFWPA